MAGVTATRWLVVFLCCAVFTAVVAQSGIAQTTATLSEARDSLAATCSGDLVFFGGGYTGVGVSDRVDICNVSSGSWTTATLSVPRANLAAATSGNLAFFGGGWNGSSLYNQVDIYNMSDGSWSTATLSQARCCLAATSVGSIVLFGGGLNGTWNNLADIFNVVDVYNVTSNTWTTATLSQARYNSGTTSVTNRWALFAGGWNGTNYLNVVDVYDLWNDMWYTTTLSQPRELPAAASFNDLAFFGGGKINFVTGQSSNVVDIYNLTTQTWNIAVLSQNRSWLAASSIGDIVAFGGGTPNGSPATNTFSAVVDMYNTTSNLWFTANLSQPRDSLAATSSTNKIFFGGGQNSNGTSNTVDIFDISLPSPTPVGSPTPTSSPTPTPTPTPTAIVSPSSSTTPTPVATPTPTPTQTPKLSVSALIGGPFELALVLGLCLVTSLLP